jgi:hypothetical protein
MHFHANIALPPSEVLKRLAALPGERGSSWASYDLLEGSVGRLYVRVNGPRFEASPTAGVAVLTVIAAGQVSPGPTGSTVALRFTYGPFPTFAAPLLLVVALPLAALLTSWGLREGLSMAAFGLAPALLLGAGWWAGTSSVRWVLRQLSQAIGGAHWVRGQAATTGAA